jgi:hypothetical protein
MTKPIIVNFFAGPGAGKSTLAAHVFAELKWRGVNAELITEYAKSRVWEGATATLDDQFYVLAKQYHRQYVLRNDVDIAITDSPLPLGLVYGKNKNSPAFNLFLMEVFNAFTNINYFVLRVKEYNPKGRMQNENEARDLDREIRNTLRRNNIGFTNVVGERGSVTTIVNSLIPLVRT